MARAKQSVKNAHCGKNVHSFFDASPGRTVNGRVRSDPGPDCGGVPGCLELDGHAYQECSDADLFEHLGDKIQHSGPAYSRKLARLPGLSVLDKTGA